MITNFLNKYCIEQKIKSFKRITQRITIIYRNDRDDNLLRIDDVKLNLFLNLL
jgi:hypothetical protein